MAKSVPAIYENGVLRPLEPLDLSERQRVAISVVESPTTDIDSWLDHEFLTELEAAETVPSLAEVRAALAGLNGNLSDDIRRERDSRG